GIPSHAPSKNQKSIMIDLVRQYLGEDVEITPELYQKWNDLFDEVHIKKGQKVVRAGSYSKYAYWILKGAARSYYLKDSVEIVNWFALEGEMAVSMDNYMGRESKETILFMEDSQCMRLDMEKSRLLEKTEIVVANLAIKLLEEYIDFIDTHARNLADREGMERYVHLMENNPEYIHRIPITHLASYLGMSRENLSRLRKKYSM
ncbi:MAG: Crp/Fnr family transcriptional regulator, partial [Bacteroidota bacterium]